MNINDWNENNISAAKSKGGVIVTAHPYSNLIKTDCEPWPPPEIVQKLYESRQIRAFSGEERNICISGLGYYCDLQSLHSEDAITWSVFGTISRFEQEKREAWLTDLFKMIQLPDANAKSADIYLWRRVPHPDNRVPGGPEIDVGILTENTLILGEAKWLSGVGTAQGKGKNKDQIQLRGEYLKEYGPKFYRALSQLVVLGIGLNKEAFVNNVPEGVIFRSITWEEICSLNTHPIAEEVERYYNWKVNNTKMFKKYVRHDK
ncbi:MAG TPA: hypothetical protein PKV11_06700 [Smithella sp.]|nr:hypothetical protein [Smithella sp.]